MIDRTQKKCVLASFGVHALLCVLLLVGPAFLQSKEVVDSSPILEFVAFQTTYDSAQGGGDAKAKPAEAELPKPLPPQPKPPEPMQEPVKEAASKPSEPKVQKETVVKQSEHPDAVEPLEKKPRLPEISTKMVKRNDNQPEKKKQAEQAAKAEAKRQADARKRMADTITQAANNIANGVSPGTEIKLKGPGGGGIPYANFFDAVKSVYSRAWILPDGVTDDQATTTATVLIARDGTVVNARITSFSRNTEVDRSVQATLDRVKWAAPLPDSEVKDQREVTINFNVKAKRASG